MSFQQRGIWLFEQLHPGTSAYHVPFAIEFGEELDHEALRTAVDAVTRNHPALRTNFAYDDVTFEPIQRVHADMPVPFCSSDLRKTADPAASLRELTREHATTPFDLTDGPLIRTHLALLPGRQRLLITLHHLIADGWSLHVLIRDLNVAYQAITRGRTPDLQRTRRDYHDWSTWQRERAVREWEPHLAYYRAALRSIPASPPWPSDWPRPTAPTLAAGRYDWLVPSDALARMRRHAADSGTTLYAVLLSALALVLHRWSGQRSVVIGTPMANRAHPVLQGIVGYFVNVGVIPVSVEPSSTVTSLLPQAHRLMLNALSHQDLPFELLVEDLAPSRSRVAHPIFQVMLALQNTPDAWVTERLHEPADAAKFDLTFNAVESPDGLRMNCVYAAELFRPSTVERLCAALARILEAGEL